MKESRKPKNDLAYPAETTTKLLGAMAPEGSQLARNFEMIFPGATRVIPVVIKKSPRAFANDDSVMDKTTEEWAADIVSAEINAERIKEYAHHHHRHKHKKTSQHHARKHERTKQALPTSEAVPQAGK